MARRWTLSGSFGVEHLVLGDAPQSAPLGPTEVRLRLRAASLNYRDLLMVRGEYNPKLVLPMVPLSDGAGDVAETGSAVTRVRVGDRVSPIFSQGWHDGLPTRAAVTQNTLGGPRNGCLTEELVVDQADVVQLPAHLSYEEATTLPCAGLTAWSALVEEGELTAGQSVLVQGTGGVSLFALTFAKALGARVLATTGSADKEPQLRALGADHVINYRSTPDWGKAAKAWAGGEGMDHVVDVGGASTLAESLRAVRPGGRVSLIGILGGSKEALNLNAVLMFHVRIQGIFVGHRAGFERMNAFIADKQLRPVVDRVFDFADAPAAFAYLASGAHFGKVVVRIP